MCMHEVIHTTRTCTSMTRVLAPFCLVLLTSAKMNFYTLVDISFLERLTSTEPFYFDTLAFSERDPIFPAVVLE